MQRSNEPTRSRVSAEEVGGATPRAGYWLIGLYSVHVCGAINATRELVDRHMSKTWRVGGLTVWQKAPRLRRRCNRLPVKCTTRTLNCAPCCTRSGSVTNRSPSVCRAWRSCAMMSKSVCRFSRPCHRTGHLEASTNRPAHSHQANTTRQELALPRVTLSMTEEPVQDPWLSNKFSMASTKRQYCHRNGMLLCFPARSSQY